MPSRTARRAAPILLAAIWAAAGGAPAAAQATGGTDRVITLVAEARQSPCFLAPSRPPLGAPVGAEVAAAASGGDGAAMYRIAEAFLADPARSRQALAWLERAAMAGAMAAAADAGSLHAAGRGTVQDEDTAAAWWRYGASRGDLRSMACLSSAYLLGRGVPQDLAQAARWALLREARAPGRLLLRPTAAGFERALPPATLAEARRLARETPEPTPPPSGAGAPEAEALVLAPGVPAAPSAGDALRGMRPPPRPVGEMAEFRSTGFVVGQPEILLVSAHALRSCQALAVHAGYAQFGGVEVRAVHEGLDLALLTVPGLARRPLPVRAEVRLGEEVILLGYPAGGVARSDATVTVGHVSGFGAGAGEHRMQVTAPAGPGASGGPLLDRQGAIVGVFVATFVQAPMLLTQGVAPQNTNYAVGARHLARFLDDHGIGRGTPGPSRPVPDLVAEAGRSVVEVVCWRRAGPAAQQARSPARGRAAEGGRPAED